MSDVTLSYKGSDILELSDSGSATLKTGGTYCEADIELEYVKPSGGEDFLVKRITNTLTEYRNTNAISLTYSAFNGCSRLQSVFLPNAECGAQSFLNCSSLTSAVIKTVTANYCFQNCPSLASADVTGTGRILAGAFQGCSALNILVLRASSIPSLANINCFNSTPFASGGTGGTIYIPKALYDHLGDGTSLDYKSATNWSTIDGYGTITWAQIEGSYYETHYADGTPIPT